MGQETSPALTQRKSMELWCIVWICNVYLQLGTDRKARTSLCWFWIDTTVQLESALSVHTAPRPHQYNRACSRP